jgi:hypothetical protein
MLAALAPSDEPNAGGGVALSSVIGGPGSGLRGIGGV